MRRNDWIRRLGFGLAGLLLSAAAAFAAPAANPLDQKVEMVLKDTGAEDLFRTLARMTGVEAEVAPGVRGKVSIELHNVRVRTLLDAVCESIGCRWTLDSGKLRVTPGPAEARGSGKPTAPKDPIDLKVTGADVHDLLNTFAQIMSAKAVIDEAVKGTVSLNLENTPCDQALDAVCMAAGCDWSYDADKRVLRVVPKPKRK
jgi:type II secretory pathway component GspD/PulD (secretin)